LLKENEEVLELSQAGQLIRLKTNKGDYQARSVIIASGKKSRELNVAGEKEFKNRGLTYCATCDGPLFAGKDVAIIGGGNSALDAALGLIKIARHIYIINHSLGLSGDAIMIRKVQEAANVTILNNFSVTEVLGDKFVKSIKIKSANQEKELAVQGVFVEIGLIPNSVFAQGVKKNSENEIIIDAHNQTNIAGIFAAGDVTDVPQKQIIIAAGEGSKAVLSAFHYLSQKDFN